MKKQITIAILIAAFLLASLTFASAITISDISVSPSTVEPGKTFSTSISLENNFDDDVENVQVALDLSLVPISSVSSTALFVEKIRNDDSESLDFDLKVNSDATEGVYKFPVVIQYILNNQTIKEGTMASVTVNSKPHLEVTSEGYLIAGQKGTINFKITNSGLAKARFLQINAQEGSYNLLSTTNVYIGDLNSDDFDSFTLDILAKNPGTIIVPVDLKYRDFVNNNYDETQNVQVRVYSQKEALSLGLIKNSNAGVYVTLVVILIILYIVYSRLRKWQRNKKANRNKLGAK